MNRFLTFRSHSVEQKFQSETFVRTKYFLQGYILLCLIYVVWTNLLSTCYNFHHNCQFTNLLIGALFFLVGTYLPIQTKKPFIVRAMLLLPCLYIHLLILDTYNYHLSVHLIVMQTVFTSGLTVSSWRLNLLFNLVTYSSLYLTIRFLELEFMINENAISFLEDLLLYNLIPLAISAYIEKGRRERWVLLETFKKSERSFVSLVEKMNSPIYVLDNNKRVIFANQKALTILQKYYNNISNKIPIQKMNINFVSMLTPPSKILFEKAIQDSTLEKGINTKISLQDPNKEIDNPELSANNANFQDSKVENLIQESRYIYEINCIRTLWKSSHAYLVSIQDITNSVKIQSVVSTNYIALIQNIRSSIESAQQIFENLPISNIGLLTSTYKPLIQAILNMDSLQYSLLNTSAIFDFAYDKFKVEQEQFDIRDILVYMFEVLSIKSIKQKIEMHLKFEAGFPDRVSGDSLRFAQLMHNLITNILDNSKEIKLEVYCNVKTITNEGKYLLEFKIEFPTNEVLKYEYIQSLLDSEEESFGCTIDILKKNQIETKFMIFKPLLKFLNGSTRTINKIHTNEIYFEVPFDNTGPSASQIDNRREWNVPILSKFNLTNTKTKNSKNYFVWSAQPLPVSTDKLILDPIQSPYIMKEKLSERIKQQMSETQSSSASSQLLLSGNKSQIKTPNYQEFQKQKNSLAKFAGKEISSTQENSTPPVMKKGNNENRAQIPNEMKILEQKEIDKIPVEEESLRGQVLNIKEVHQSPKLVVKASEKLEQQSEKISLSIKRENSKRAQLMTKKREASPHKKLTIQTSEEEIKQPIVLENKEANSEGINQDKPPNSEISLTVNFKEDDDQKNKGLDKVREMDLNYLNRGIERVKKARRKSRSISHELSKSDYEGHGDPAKESRMKANHYKPAKPSFFSPVSPKENFFDPQTQEFIKAYFDEGRMAPINEPVDEEFYHITRSKLKQYEDNLKIAVANILLGILTMYGKKKRVSVPTSQTKFFEKEEKKPEEDQNFPDSIPKQGAVEKGSLNALDEVGNEETQIEKVVKESFLDGKLNGSEFLDRIIELLASRISIEKNEKEFMAFLAQYVRIVEKKLFQQDFRKYYNKELPLSLDDDEDKFEHKLMMQSAILGGFQEAEMYKPFRAFPLVNKRKNSDESVFSINSDAPEKNPNLLERILFTPSAINMIRFRVDPRKLTKKQFSTPGEASEEENLETSTNKQSMVEGSPLNAIDLENQNKQASDRIRARPNAVQLEFNDLLINETTSPKVEEQHQIIPFKIPIEGLPIFIKARVETFKRQWKGGPQQLQEEIYKEYSYMEDFTILVVDDNNFVLKTLELAPCPYKKSFDYGRNGLEGFTKYKSMIEQHTLYHIILMDLMMPTCDGLEATKMIRDYETVNTLPRTFICAVSSFEDEATRRKCFEAGMDDYCCKPVGSQTLTQMILSRCQSLGISPILQD